MTRPLGIIGRLDITELEEAWEEYKNSDFTDMSMTSWMGERTGSVLREIRILRTQVEGLQAALDKERSCLPRETE
jgi:hypothetical protein